MELDFNYSSVASLTAAALRSGLPISVLVLKQQAQQMELPDPTGKLPANGMKLFFLL